MCTAITYRTHDHYFGRNLDLERSYSEHITITPRCFPLHFRMVPPQQTHYAIIGVAHIAENYPLYYDAVNEAGLAMAGLRFPDYTDYKPEASDQDNIAPFELIPWILGRCATVDEAKAQLFRLNLIQLDFSQELPLTPLHWIIADRNRSITVESVREGLFIYENTPGVLTNSPPFPLQLFRLNDFMHLTCDSPENHFSAALNLHEYSRGMGALGLPGDLSSGSRFVRAAFTKLNAVSGNSESDSVSQVFHILGTVAQIQGCVRLEENLYERTVYSICCNTDRGIYYYTTYENSQVTAVDLHRENLDGKELISYPLLQKMQVQWQN